MITGDNNEEVKLLPNILMQPMLHFEDAPQEALASNLSTGWPACFSLERQGRDSMQCNPLQFVAPLNRLWDGKSFTAHRKMGDDCTPEHRRLTLNLMMQSILLQNLASQVEGIGRQSIF